MLLEGEKDKGALAERSSGRRKQLVCVKFTAISHLQVLLHFANLQATSMPHTHLQQDPVHHNSHHEKQHAMHKAQLQAGVAIAANGDLQLEVQQSHAPAGNLRASVSI